MATELPELSAYFQSGGLVDAVLNLGLPAPIDVQVAGSNLEASYETAREARGADPADSGRGGRLHPAGSRLSGAASWISTARAPAELGLNQKEVVNNVITALTSNQMIAPSFWIDPKTGNDYMLTVQYPERQVKNLVDLQSIPLRGRQAHASDAARCGQQHHAHQVAHRSGSLSASPDDRHLTSARSDEDLGRIATAIDGIIADTNVPAGLNVNLRGMVQGMRASFQSFTLGLLLAVVLLYLILVAQFRSFVDPFIILLAVPPGSPACC